MADKAAAHFTLRKTHKWERTPEAIEWIYRHLKVNLYDAAASHQPSVCTAAAPAAVGIGLLAAPPEAPSKTLPRLVVRWPVWSLCLLQRLRCCYALASMLPSGRHSCRSGRTPHENAVSYSAWHTPIACVEVVVLYRWGGWPLSACPRTYLHANPIKARPLPSSALSCAPSQVL
jgi:hypothetical protein